MVGGVDLLKLFQREGRESESSTNEMPRKVVNEMVQGEVFNRTRPGFKFSELGRSRSTRSSEVQAAFLLRLPFLHPS